MVSVASAINHYTCNLFALIVHWVNARLFLIKTIHEYGKWLKKITALGLS